MWLGVLGPLCVHDESADVPVPAAKHRVLLASLLVHANHVVSFDELAEIIWDAAPSSGARTTVRNYVLRLRRQLGPAIAARLVTRDPGYLIEVGEDELDLLRFGALCGTGGSAVRSGDWPRAHQVLSEALGLWRGTPLADIPSSALQADEVPRLEQIRLQALEWRVEAGLNLGRHGELTPELASLAAQYPLHERFSAQFMLALYRCGRQAEALAAYQQARQALIGELGVEPGVELRDMHQQVLAGDPQLGPPSPAPAALGRASAGPPVPRGLPGAPAHFVGRLPELTVLSGLLDQRAAGGPVVISAIGGMPGVGKTALAVYWAHRVAEQFPDGQLYVNLRGFGPSAAPMTAADALQGFLDALAVPAARIPEGLEARAARYRSLLAGKRMLVVLDNARDEQQVRPLLPGSPGCLVLVTSRSRLAGLVATEGAQAITLDVLTAAEAHELLASRLGAERLAAEPAAVERLIELCERVPLALSIAAANVVTHPGLRLAGLAAGLAGTPLDALDTGDDAASVRTVFSWSYRNLSVAGARMFRLFGLAPGPDISLAAAASLAGVPPGAARHALTELTRSHLLAEPVLGRFGCHDLLRAYAAETAHRADPASEQRAAIHRVLDHYLHTAVTAALLMDPGRTTLAVGPPQPGVTPEQPADDQAAIAWLRAEHAVLMAATALAAEAGFDVHAWQIPWSLAEFLPWQGRWQDLLTAQQTAVAAARRIPDREGLAMALRDLGHACVRLGSHDSAHAHLREALDLLGELGDREGLGRVHLDIGHVFHVQGRYADSLHHAQQALAIFRAGEQRVGQAYALNGVGWCHAKLGDLPQALRCCEEALELHRECGNRYGEAATLDSLGYAHHHLDNHAAAIGCYGLAVQLYEELGDRFEEALTLTRLGDSHHVAGDLPLARSAWQRALSILADLEHPEADLVRQKLRGLI